VSSGDGPTCFSTGLCLPALKMICIPRDALRQVWEIASGCSLFLRRDNFRIAREAGAGARRSK
jgi:hypothetical protein